MAGVNFLSGYDASPTIEAAEMEPSSGATFFHSEYKKHGDLREMLDSSKDSLKLDAMKRIISMLAKGRDVSDLFPAVVKNVASKNIEVKKLVYVYLTRYAEEQQDLALLSISTFQRALKDPNQLIRASALRVLSSIRVPVIVPIMLPAIKESALDMSPFVRKTAAHAIPKLYSLEPEMKEELIGIIEKLLADRTTLVVGSAAMAFEEVCPDRVELIHKNYRKLVNLLVDVEEWGQVTLVNMLTRYARTQFQDPNIGHEDVGEEGEKREFYENSEDEEVEDEEQLVIDENKVVKPLYKMDPDHRLLLRSTKPLLQSRNASVVMATAQLYWHVAPRPEVGVVAKALVRLLRSHYEVQAIVLNSIAAMTIQDSGRGRMFKPFLRQFFVRASDPGHVKILKLEILTNLARADNISILLREFQSYISGGDKGSAAATIQAIGRCAASIPEVTATCLSGLVHLMSSTDQAVVAESVLEMKKLLQTQEDEHKDIISQMAKLLDSVEVASARAAILWVVGEYCARIPLIAPDVLRKMAKTFCSEEDDVKLQVLNLAAKLCLTNPRQAKVLAQYVLNLAKYDMNYDIRDRARFIRAFLFPAPGEEAARLHHLAKKVFLASKPPPTIQSKFKNRAEYQLGSLSHYINAKANGYQDLPEFPEVPPDPSVRNVEPPKPAENPWKPKEETVATKKGVRTKLYDTKAAATNGKAAPPTNGSSGTSESGSSSSDSDSSSDESEPEKKPAAAVVRAARPLPVQQRTPAPAAPSVNKPKQESESSSGSGSSSDEEEPAKTKKAPVPAATTKKSPPVKASVPPKPSGGASAAGPKSNLDLLLDLEAPPMGLSLPALTPAAVETRTYGGGSVSLGGVESTDGGGEAAPMWVATTASELLNKLATGGVQVDYRYTRHPHLYAPDMLAVELTLTNTASEDAGEVKVGAKRLMGGMSVHEFPGILNIAPSQTISVTLGIDYRDTTQPAQFDLVIGNRPQAVSLPAPTGEMIRPIRMAELQFGAEQGKLRGMCEMRGKAELPSIACDSASVVSRIYRAANLLQVPSGVAQELRFAGRTLSAKHLVLLTVKLESTGTGCEIIVNTENIVIGSMLLKEITLALQRGA